MFTWINLGLMAIFTALFVALYIRSVSPAALEEKMGVKAYPHCGKARALSILFLVLVLVSYLVYDFYPLPIAALNQFPWPYWISLIVATLIAIPTTFFVITGLKDAGDEATQPTKETEMFGGIYNYIRHPQTWEFGYFFALGFFLHSPFLVIISLIWLPIMAILIRAEEKDLLLRYGEKYRKYIQTTGGLLPKKK